MKSISEILPLDTIINRIKDGSLNLQPDFQRDYVWREPMRSELIMSVIEQYPISDVIFYQKDNLDDDIDSEYLWDCVDGQQRLTTILNFFEDKSYLNINVSKKLYNKFKKDFYIMANKTDKKIANKFKKIVDRFDSNRTKKLKYSDLPNKLKNRILTYQIQITNIDSSDDEIKEYFRRVQNQEKLKAGEIINALPNSYVIEQFDELNNPELFKQKFNYVEKNDGILKILCNIVGIFNGSLNLGDSDKKIVKFAETETSLSKRCVYQLDILKLFFEDIESLDFTIKLKKTGIKLLLLFIPEHYEELNNKYGVIIILKWLERIFNKLSSFNSRFEDSINNEFINYDSDVISKYREVSTLTKQSHNIAEIKSGLNRLCELLVYEIEKNESLEINNKNRYISDQQKYSILNKYNYKCQGYECHQTLTMGNVEFDHTIPFSVGGDTNMINLKPYCHDCNQNKKAILNI